MYNVNGECYNCINNHHYVKIQMQGQLLSDLLNQQKICELFEQPSESQDNKKEQISLNFTVTSRENNPFNSTHKNQYSSNSFFEQAKASLDHFQNWCNKKLQTQNNELLGRLNDLTDLTQKKQPNLLSMPSLQALKENKRNFVINECEECRKRGEIISQLQNNVIQLKEEIMQKELKEDILRGVQLSLAKEKQEQLKNIIQNLKTNVEKTNLQKSNLFDKTKDLQKRLGCLQKSFSNAKNSTNPTNANDTMNRENSIISFDNYESSFEEQVRYLEKLREKYGNLVNEDVKEKLEEKMYSHFSKQEEMSIRKRSLYYPIYVNYRTFVEKLKMSKKHKEPMEFKQNTEPNQSGHKNHELKSLKMKIISLQNSNVNLRTANNEIKTLLENSLKKNKELEEKAEAMEAEMMEMSEKAKKIKNAAKKMVNDEKKMKTQMKMEIDKLQKENKQLTMEIEDFKGSIRVYCRVRPRIHHQLKYPSILESHESSVLKDGKKYQFTHVFNENSTQSQVFHETKRLVQCAFEGRNLCIFAYGQTGSGKTYTLHGTESSPGLAPNIIHQIFSLIGNQQEKYSFNISMGMLEIYLDTLKDLYELGPTGKKVEIKESATGIYLQNCPFVTLSEEDKMMKVYLDGIEKRKKRCTEKNEESSRSHCVTIINIVRENKQNKSVKYSKITLIDLAGAEKNTSSNPILTKQSSFINKSLSALATVMSEMKNNSDHISYRNSKLTHMLKDSLNSKGKILMFVNVSPAQNSHYETQRSLEFAKNVQRVERSDMPHKERENSCKGQKSRRGSSNLSMY